MATRKPQAESPRKAGRPRDPEKLEAILEAGWAEFLRSGVKGASLDAIARRAGVTRVTLYNHFPDKAALFAATVRREMDGLQRSQIPVDPACPLRGRLIEFGLALMRYLTSPSVVSFYSVLAGDLRHDRDLAQAFYQLGPGMTHRNLTAILKQARERGEVRIRYPREAAEQLIGMWQGLSNYQLSLGVHVEELVVGLPQRITRTVDLFLRAYGT